MTPEFAAGFNAGIAAARKVAEDKRGAQAESRGRAEQNEDVDSWVSYNQGVHVSNDIAHAISALSVPSDLVAVPREPSFKMVEQARYTIPGPIGHEICDADIEDIYRTMIAATEDKT